MIYNIKLEDWFVFFELGFDLNLVISIMVGLFDLYLLKYINFDRVIFVKCI